MDPPTLHESDSCSQKAESLSMANNIVLAEASDDDPVKPAGDANEKDTMALKQQRILSAHSVFQDIVAEFNESSALVPVDPDEVQEQPQLQSCSTKSRELPLKKYDLVTGFDHCFVKVPWKERLSVLFATLRRSSERKVIVMFSSWESCQFHTILFRQLEMLQLFNMHENVANVAQSYIDFTYFYPGTLFASEIAMREFDIPPDVDYVVQYEPPTNPTEYIYRMNTAQIRDTSSHMALLFLTSEEMEFLDYFDDDIECTELEARKVTEVQRIAVKLVSKHDDLNELASNALRAFMMAYKSHGFSDIYDYTNMYKNGVRHSFGEPHLPDDLVEYFECNQGAEAESMEDKTQSNKSQYHKETHQWMKKEKTWRKGHTDTLEDDRSHMQHQWRKKEKTWWKGQSPMGDVDRDDRHRKQYPWLINDQPSVKSESGNGESVKSPPWMKKEKTWRSGQSKQWMTKEDKTWKHTHVNL
ncbi:hypothetical protein ACHAWU_006502 [Discostella pseudostelligera]|uniref:ATP-dependent RNA helicase n=1 Tax=Discostella pseudostelligera TaxID=259834 RepID=A0ABD3ME92_9STRA